MTGGTVLKIDDYSSASYGPGAVYMLYLILTASEEGSCYPHETEYETGSRRGW